MSAARAIGGPVASPVASIGTAEERKMARMIADSFLRQLPKNVLRADIQQAALIGLWDGIRKHGDDDLAPEQRRYYLIRRIRGQIIDELRAQDWLHRRARKTERTAAEPSLTIVRFDDIGHPEAKHPWEESLVGSAPSPEDECLRKAEQLQLESEIEEAPLTARHRRVLREHYWGGRKFKDIGKGLGVSEPRISQLHARALATLQAWRTGEVPEPKAWWDFRVVSREASLAIKKKHREKHDHRASDRRAGDAAGAVACPSAHPRAVPERGLGGAPAPAAHRPVPRGARGAELGREAPPHLRLARPEAVAPRTAPEADGGLAVTEPVPSVLPAEGLDLKKELTRYRDWLVDQALLRTGYNAAHASELLGLCHASVNKILRERGVSGPRGPRGRYARRAVTPPESEPAAAALAAPREPEPERSPEDIWLEHLAARIPWDRVAALRAQGVRDGVIAHRLAPTLGTHRFRVEKALRLPRPLAKCEP